MRDTHFTFKAPSEAFSGTVSEDQTHVLGAVNNQTGISHIARARILHHLEPVRDMDSAW